MTEILAFEDVHRAYVRGVEVLHGVSFSLRQGEVVGLLGLNGAGKTTLMRTAMGMLEAQQGAVRIFGLDPRVEPLEVKRRVGYVSEEQILPPYLRVGEVMALHRQLSPTWDDSLAAQLAARFRISSGAKIGTLSRGEARQVALLCAAAHRPELLLLDEPAGGLDPVMRREFLYSYKGKGLPAHKASYSYRFWLGAWDRTLSSEEIDEFRDAFLAFLSGEDIPLR